MASIDDVYNLLNGNAPWPGDDPYKYLNLCGDAANAYSVATTIQALIGEQPAPDYPTVFNLLSSIFEELQDPIETILGDPPPGKSLAGQLVDAQASLDAIDAGQSYQNSNYLDYLKAAVDYPNSQVNTIHEDFNRVLASVLLGITISDLIKDAVGEIGGPIGTLLQTIGILFTNTSGGNTTINYNDCLQASGNVPPYDSLTEGPFLTLGAGADIDIPQGVYGYEFHFTVPGYWAHRGDFTEDLSPSIAILEFLRGAYSFGNPTYVRRENWLAYPLHPAASKFTIDLQPGVTGTYAELRLA